MSATQSYLTCPQRFAFQYIQRVPRTVADVPIHWRIGTVGHAALEAVYKERRKDKGHGSMWNEHYWELAKQALAQAWTAENMPDPNDSMGQWDRVHEAVERTMRAEVESWEHIVGVEYKLFVREGVNLIGYADLLRRVDSATIEIRDYKFRSTKTPPDDLARDLQMAFYGALVRRKLPWVRRVRVAHYNPPIADQTVVEMPSDASEGAYWRVRATADMARRDEQYEAIVGSQCATCAYQSMCPAWASTQAADAAATEEASINEGLF